MNDEPQMAQGQWEVTETLHEEGFDADALVGWTSELEDGGTVEVMDGSLEIDVPAGCSVWFKPIIDGPVLIEYTAVVVGEGGPNDRVSDLNCFWMASDARNPDDLFAVDRSGAFPDYNQLRCYYVGYGGNSNGTTRFRRYIGDPERRPLSPEHDLTDAPNLITPNQAMKIQLVAADGRIEYWRDGELIFEYDDPEPYTRGHFAFRTVSSHLRIDDFAVRRLERIAGGGG